MKDGDSLNRAINPARGDNLMTYFVSKRKSSNEPFRIVYREVKTHTSKGYPLTYELKSLPEEFATWEEAMAATERLNAGRNPSGFAGGPAPSWP